MPYSQLLRVKRICNSEDDFIKQANEVCVRFREKDYDPRILNACMLKVSEKDRDSLLSPKPHLCKKQPIVLTTTFSPMSQSIKDAVKKHWHILSSDPIVGHEFINPPIFATKRSSNLRDRLVKTDLATKPTHFLSSPAPGNFPCLNCINCNALIKGDHFLHPHTGTKMKVRGRITCRSTHVVDLLKCPCALCYVGKTKRELRVRISEHKSSIRNRDERSPVARHFNSAGHGVCMLRFMGIEVVRSSLRGGDREKKLLQREADWIHHLQTEYPGGLNDMYDPHCRLF